MAKGISLFLSAPSAPRRVFRLFSENQTSPETFSLPARIAVIHSSCCLCPKTAQKHQMQLPICLTMFYLGTTLYLLSSAHAGSQVSGKEPALASRCCWSHSWGWEQWDSYLADGDDTPWAARGCWDGGGPGSGAAGAMLEGPPGNRMEHPPEGTRSSLLQQGKVSTGT